MEALDTGLVRLTGKAPAHVVPNYVRAPNPIVYDDAEGHGMRFEAAVKAIAEGGTMHATSNALRIEGARSLTLFIAAATGFRGFDRAPDRTAGQIAADCRARLLAAEKKGYAAIRAAHIADHQKLFRRVTFSLPVTAAADLPTNERLAAAAKEPDPALAALYFQYGRYLLLSSSRPGTQPANLQGIWNELVRPPWSSNWTANINVQMNYWPAETCNLAECHAAALRSDRRPQPQRRAAPPKPITAAADGSRTTTWICGANPRRLAISARARPPGPIGA